VDNDSNVTTQQEIQPMQTNDTDPSSSDITFSGMNMFSRPTSSILMVEPDIDQDPATPLKNIEQLEIPDPELPTSTASNCIADPTSFPVEEELFTSGIRITKSNSVALRKKGGSVDDVSNSTANKLEKRQRWSSIPSDPSRLERLEHRLSLLSDDADDNSITSIKNMVRKVSNAFNSSYQQVYEDSPRSHTSGESDISRDLGKILRSPMPQELEKRNSILREDTSDSENVIKTNHFHLNQTTTSMIEDTELNHETQHTVSPADDSGIISSEANDSNEDLNKRWSTDVDQVFDEVNADLDSIADSIASDHGRISDSEGQDPATTYGEVSSIGLDTTKRVAIVDMRLKEANSSIDTVPSPTSSSSKKGNFEVKRVADRIKEYKRLIDAEKRRTSWRRREPRPINEMMESLDTIHSKDNRLTSAYSNMRRRYRSRDLEGSSMNSSADASPRSSCSSIKRSLSENFASALENSQSCPVSYSSTPSYDESFGDNNTERTLTDSVLTLRSKKDFLLDNADDISKRTQRYQKALENFDGRTRLASTGDLKSEQTVILRRRPKDLVDSDYVVCRNSGDWTRKAQTLPHPRRLKAIKRITRADSEEASDDTETEMTRQKSVEEKSNDSSSTETTSSDENKNKNRCEVLPSSKKTHRSISLPRQKKRQVSNTNTIHEEVSSKYVNPRLSTRSNSNPENNGPRVLNRGRIRENSKGDTPSHDHKTSTLPRGRRREGKMTSETNDKTINTHRSVSLPRRAPGLARNNLFPTSNNNNNKNNDNKENEKAENNQKSSSITILRSPSIRCIQSNHVNNRIKDYFVNLQRSVEISRSRPNLVIIGSCSESDPDPDVETYPDADDVEIEGEIDMSSNEEQTSNDDEDNNNDLKDKKDKILKGTVRSMIQKYGKQNYVFD